VGQAQQKVGHARLSLARRPPRPCLGTARYSAIFAALIEITQENANRAHVPASVGASTGSTKTAGGKIACRFARTQYQTRAARKQQRTAAGNMDHRRRHHVRQRGFFTISTPPCRARTRTMTTRRTRLADARRAPSRTRTRARPATRRATPPGEERAAREYIGVAPRIGRSPIHRGERSVCWSFHSRRTSSSRHRWFDGRRSPPAHCSATSPRNTITFSVWQP